MNKQCKTLLTLLLLLGANAYSKDALISKETLNANRLDPLVLKQLVAEKILIPAKLPQYFILNEKKVDEILATSNEPDVVEFLNWLRSIAGSDTEVNQKNPGDMTPASQDLKL